MYQAQFSRSPEGTPIPCYLLHSMARPGATVEEDGEQGVSEGAVSYPKLRSMRSEVLRKAKGRRTTLPGGDAATGAEEATTPWKITTTAQLQYWAHNDAEEFLRVLNELRTERDLAIECVNLGKGAEEQLKDQVLEYSTQLIDQGKELTTWKEDAQAALRENDRLMAEVRNTPAPSTTPSTAQEGKRSPKHPDPPVYTGGDNPSFDDWALRIHDKLSVNPDHFANEAAKAIYVISRTGGDAAGHLTVYRTNGSPDYSKRQKQCCRCWMTFILTRIVSTTLAACTPISARELISPSIFSTRNSRSSPAT